MNDPLLLPARPVSDNIAYRLSPWRWFVLFFFSIANMNQCLAWFSFNSLPEPVMQEYFGSNLNKDTLDLILNWGPIIGVVFFPIQTYILQLRNGFKKGVWFGLWLLLAGNIIRCVPIVVAEFTNLTLLSNELQGSNFSSVTTVPAATNIPFHCSTIAFLFYHAGQILIAAAGPFFMGTTTRLSCIWFGENERTTATAIATTANGLGTTIGFLNPEWLAPTAAGIPNIFWFSLALAILPVICALIYFPAGPPFHASAAAAASMPTDSHGALQSGLIDVAHAEEHNGNKLTNDKRGWFYSLVSAGTNPSFVVLVLAASILAGVASGWQGLLQIILEPANITSEVSWIGFGNAAAGNIAAIAAGGIIDCFKLQRRLQAGILLGLIGCLISTAWFTFQLPSTLWSNVSATTNGLLPRSEATLIISITLAGFFQGVTSPLFYELAAELIYPVKEGMSAGVLVLLLNASACIMIVCNNYLTGGSMNLIMTSTVFLVFLLVGLVVKAEYKRPENK